MPTSILSEAEVLSVNRKGFTTTSLHSRGFTTTSLHSRGFTLVELLVVISIIAVLSVIGMTIFNTVQKNARDARRKADIDAISKALEVYYDDSSGLYPVSLTGTMFTNSAIPQDPVTGTSNCGTNACRYCFRGAAVGNCGPAAGAADNVTDNLPSRTSYNVCANLEGTISVGGTTLTYYCHRSQR